ncbi:MAG: KilA-N domain-containing protein [Proteobacteria bacterium]|nr:MAG: KilA-N domain-containing protein [Pseudomonadota bacterium]
MNQKTIITVKDANITILNHNHDDYISLTDMAKGFDGGVALIEQWLRNKDTIEFLGIWELIHENECFNSSEFEGIKNESGTNRFYLSVKKWIDATNAVGIVSKAGRYGGTYAHKDIAFEFGSWLSPEFKLYLIKEFQRLKEDENHRLSLGWSLNRTLAKINYRIHTDAIKDCLIPQKLTKEQKNKTYASEADVLNIALFGKTAKDWRESNPDLDGNIRDYATIEQLLILANLESMNAEFIRMNLAQVERLERLNNIAIIQLKSLLNNHHIKKLTANDSK